MNKLKEALIQFANSNPSLFPNPNSYPTLIEQQFSQFFPGFQTTPNHPPYAAMIHRAIWELKEKAGSSEESISKFIKQEYSDLPWAHSTMLKHHLEKLCDRKEICMTHKQCYFLAGADSDPISPSTSEKQLKRKKNSESGKKSSGARKKLKKQKNRQDSKSKEQILVVFQEQDQVVQPLDQVTNEQENQEDGGVCANATAEIQSVEQPNDKEQIEMCGAKERKRKQNMESQRRRSKRIKKNEETQQDDEVIGSESHEVKQIVEVNTSDMPIQEEEEEELHPDNSGYINIEQIQMKKNPELPRIEDSPSSDPVFQKSGKRRWTRSQLKTTVEDTPSSDPVFQKSGKRRWTRSQIKTMSEKDALESANITKSPGCANIPKDQLDVVEYLSEDKQQAIEAIEWKEETKQTPSLVSTQKNGQRAKLRSSQKKKARLEFLDIQMESVEMPLIEPLNSICTELSHQLCDLDEPIQVQEPEDQPEEDKPKYRGRGRPPKKGKKSAMKCKVGSRGHKPKQVNVEVLGESKSTNKKVQQRHKCHGMHKMAKRSGVKKRNTGR